MSYIWQMSILPGRNKLWKVLLDKQFYLVHLTVGPNLLENVCSFGVLLHNHSLTDVLSYRRKLLPRVRLSLVISKITYSSSALYFST